MPIDIDVSAHITEREIRIESESQHIAGAQVGAQRPVHLYVMKNSLDMIKIGRSTDPARRRRDLELASGHLVELLLVLEDRGGDEAAIHHKLRRYRREGEWFVRTPESVTAIQRALGVSVQFDKTPMPIAPASYRPSRRSQSLPRQETRAERKAYRDAQAREFFEAINEGYRRRGDRLAREAEVEFGG